MSGWSASTTSSCWRRRPTCATRWSCEAASEVEVRSPAEMPDPAAIERDHRALHPRDGDRPGAVRGRRDGALPGQAGHPRRHALPVARAGAASLRPAAGRDRARLLRPAQVPDGAAMPRSTTSRCGNRPSDLVKLDVLLAGDRVDALSVIVHADEAYRRGQGARRAPPEDHPEAAVRRPRAGRDRLPRARARDGQGASQGRHGEALRRRRHPQAQAAREAEGGQEADEAGRAVEVPQEAFLSVLEIDE